MAKGGGGGDQGDSGTGILWITAALLITSLCIWYFFRVQLTKIYFAIKLSEIKLIGLFTNRLDDVRTVILTTDPATLSFKEVLNVGNVVGEYLRIPIVIIIAILAVGIYFANSTRSFKRTYNMRDLA